MANALFDRPLFVQRKHFVEEIVGLEDAIELLEGWPAEQRGLAHETLMNACHEACNGRFPLDAIRSNLARFLRKADVLVAIEDVPTSATLARAATLEACSRVNTYPVPRPDRGTIGREATVRRCETQIPLRLVTRPSAAGSEGRRYPSVPR